MYTILNNFLSICVYLNADLKFHYSDKTAFNSIHKRIHSLKNNCTFRKLLRMKSENVTALKKMHKTPCFHQRYRVYWRVQAVNTPCKIVLKNTIQRFIIFVSFSY